MNKYYSLCIFIIVSEIKIIVQKKKNNLKDTNSLAAGRKKQKSNDFSNKTTDDTKKDEVNSNNSAIKTRTPFKDSTNMKGDSTMNGRPSVDKNQANQGPTLITDTYTAAAAAAAMVDTEQVAPRKSDANNQSETKMLTKKPSFNNTNNKSD